MKVHASDVIDRRDFSLRFGMQLILRHLFVVCESSSCLEAVAARFRLKKKRCYTCALWLNRMTPEAELQSDRIVILSDRIFALIGVILEGFVTLSAFSYLMVCCYKDSFRCAVLLLSLSWCLFGKFPRTHPSLWFCLASWFVRRSFI
jgi:hypothetical protein